MAKFVIPTSKQDKVTEVSLDWEPDDEEVHLHVKDNDGDQQNVARLGAEGTLTLLPLDSYGRQGWTQGGGLIERKNGRDYIKVTYGS